MKQWIEEATVCSGIMPRRRWLCNMAPMWGLLTSKCLKLGGLIFDTDANLVSLAAGRLFGIFLLKKFSCKVYRSM